MRDNSRWLIKKYFQSLRLPVLKEKENLAKDGPDKLIF